MKALKKIKKAAKEKRRAYNKMHKKFKLAEHYGASNAILLKPHTHSDDCGC